MYGHELIIAEQAYPPNFIPLIDELIVDNIESGLPFSSEVRTPSIIYNAHLVFEHEEYYSHKYENEQVEAFGLFVATDLFDHSWDGRTIDPNEPLPEELLERIRAKIHPDIREEDFEAFDRLLVGMNLLDLSNAYLDWGDFLDNSQGVSEVQDEYFQCWWNFCSLVHERMMVIRLSFLHINALNEEYEEACYANAPFSEALNRTELDGFSLLPHWSSHGANDSEAPYRYIDPIRGGGFSCMN